MNIRVCLFACSITHKLLFGLDPNLLSLNLPRFWIQEFLEDILQVGTTLFNDLAYNLRNVQS